MTPEEREQLKEDMERFWANPKVRDGRYDDLLKACAKTIQAIGNDTMNVSVCRQLRNALDDVNSPTCQYGRLEQPVTTMATSNARRIAVGLPIVEFAGSRK